MRHEGEDRVTSGTTDEALQRLLDEGRARAAATDPEHARLWDSLAAATEGGSRRFRPAVTATHDALGGSCSAAAVEVGAAIELLDTAFVIHADVIDGDHLRRDRLNVSGTFHAHVASGATPDDVGDFDRTAGILAGHRALAAATRAVATCGAAPEVTNRLLDVFDADLHTTAVGELADVLSLGPGTVSLPASLAMEEQKTSAYSFALPLQAGALLAGADDKTVGRLTEIGRFRFVEELADAHVSTARAVIGQLGRSADPLASVTTHLPVLADSNEVAG
jgi:geranylgeranyl diphosphate synthase, type II